MPPPSSKPTSTTTLQWLSLVGIIWLQSINGTNTNFPAYSSQLKTSLSISQLQLNNLALASDAGKLFGFVSGLAALYLPLWLVLATGSSLGLLGYGLQFLSLSHKSLNLSYWQLCSLTVLAGNSICWINTVSYVVTIRNFPVRYRQLAIGLTTSYQGLSAKIYTDVVSSLSTNYSDGGDGDKAKAYLLLNSVAPLIVCVATSPFVREMVEDEGMLARNMDAGFVAMFVITVAAGLFAVVTSLGFAPPGNDNVVGTAVFLAVTLAVPAAEKAREVLERWDGLSREMRVHSFSVEEGNNGGLVGVEEELGGMKMEGGVREEVGVKRMVLKVDFWLYFFVYFTSATLGLVFLNNLGQIAESRGCSRTVSLVSLSSAFGFFGRLLPFLLDYHFSR